MATTEFFSRSKLCDIFRSRTDAEPAGDKPFSFFFSVPGKDSIVASKFASNSSFAARRKQRSVGGNHFHFPSADCRLLLHTIQRNAEQTEGKPLFFFFLEAENCLKG